jgi:precorrin-4/cobalt-precorrin-4 C11-methyltransferase
LNPKILEYANNAELHDAAKMDREEINNILADAALNNRLAIRLHDGDPSIYGAIREQIDKLESKGIRCYTIPGISALFAAASSLNLELTLPSITQTIIITRIESRTPVPDREKISELAKHRSTMAFYLSVHLIDKVVEELLKEYDADTPVAVVYRASWDDEKIVKGQLSDIVKKVRDAKINKTAIILVGNVINPKSYEFSKVYDPNFAHGYRSNK